MSLTGREGAPLRYIHRSLIMLLAAVPLLCLAQSKPPAAAAPAQLPPALTHKIDALFAPWGHSDTAGCALGVIRDGQLIYQHGYGMADLEHHAAISPATIFHVASMSKQFTAFAIYLLAADGKLSLDDDIRKYLPELNDYGTTITIRHLLHHTSGLRDQWSLLTLAGWRLQDVITEDDILNLIWRQKNLNFMPGDAFLYSNTGFTLLGVIVQRVSGKSLAAFTHERIFEPLGMHSTHFHDDYSVLVPGRAYSYLKQQDGSYHYIALSYSNAGATSLFTTVRDLLLWDQNFYDGRVGGKELLAQMQQTVALNNGVEIDYASGLQVGNYRGLPIVEHAGADAGFRSELIRFPAQRFSVTSLCNAAEANPSLLARQVADLFLGTQMKPPAPGSRPAPQSKTKPKPIPIDPASLDALLGEYELNPAISIVYTQENGQLAAQVTGQGKLTLFPSGERSFTYNDVDASVTFDKPGPDGIVAGAVHHQGGRDFPLKRVKRAPLSAQEIRDHAGEYYSDELHVLYTVREKDGGLVLVHPRGELPLNRQADTNSFGSAILGTVRFSCVPGHECDGFSVDEGRVQGLRFIRAQRAYAAVAVEPSVLDRYIGYYQLNFATIATISRDADHLLAQMTGRPRFELFPASDHEYFAKVADLRVSFPASAATGIEVHLNGTEFNGPRVDEATARAAQDYVARRQAENVPQPGSEAALRALIQGLRGGRIEERLSQPLAERLRPQLPALQSRLATLGELKSLEHLGVGDQGGDVYAVRFAGGDEEWRIGLTPDGRLEGLSHRPLKEATRLPIEHVDTLHSEQAGEPATIVFRNRTGAALQIYWIDPSGELRSFGSLAAHHLKTQDTFVSHLWLLGTDRQHPVALFSAAPGLTVAEVE